MRVRTALRGPWTTYSIAAPCVHLAAHAVSCVRGRAVHTDVQSCWRISQRPSRLAAYDAPGDGACDALLSVIGTGFTIQKQLPAERSSPGPPLPYTKEKDWETNAPSGCSAKASRRCRTESEGEGKSAPRRGCLPCLVAAVDDVTLGRGITVFQGGSEHGEQAAGNCCVFPISISDVRTDRR